MAKIGLILLLYTSTHTTSIRRKIMQWNGETPPKLEISQKKDNPLDSTNGFLAFLRLAYCHWATVLVINKQWSLGSDSFLCSTANGLLFTELWVILKPAELVQTGSECKWVNCGCAYFMGVWNKADSHKIQPGNSLSLRFRVFLFLLPFVLGL